MPLAEQLRKLRSSVRQEARIAKHTGGRRVAGSGNQVANKGDVKATGWRIEAKQTVTPRYSLNLKTWRAIEQQAIMSSCEPALVIEMAGRTVVVVDYQWWLANRD
jgi:hypothetical protein